MHIYFAGDHAGFEMKGKLMEFVRSLGHEVEDLGPFSLDAEDDYPDFVIPLAQKVVDQSKRLNLESEKRFNLDSETRGIVVAGSGQGEIIAMNRVRGARAALFCPCNFDLIKASRDHNNSNIFAIGARFCTLEQAKEAVRLWLETPFSGDERHVRRLAKIEKLAARSNIGKLVWK